MSIFETAKKKQPVIPEKYYKMSMEELEERVREMKEKYGKKLYIPGHHYQKDEVIQFADDRGDSLRLAQLSAKNREAEHIVFCGVHFMAETADILTADGQNVYLPDMNAGCSMADMADIYQTERAWEELTTIFGDTILPLTYVNSTAAIKAFVGKNNGATVTSSNAEKIVSWAFRKKERILFLPDQHLGRNTAYKLGVGLDEMAVWDPIGNKLEYSGPVEKVKVILWKGHCSVHETFTVENIRQVRDKYPEMKVIVHPECRFEVVQQADDAGSTSYIIDTIEKAEPGSSWAIGTEMNLVNRLISEHKDKHIILLNPYMCSCLTMNRIDLPHLVWSLDLIDENKRDLTIKVDEETAHYAKTALANMLSV